jgi:hypothetical protein
MSVSAEVATLFLDELARRNVEVKLDEEGQYTLEACGLSIKISLENVSRDFERDRDPGRVVAFVDTITKFLGGPAAKLGLSPPHLAHCALKANQRPHGWTDRARAQWSN